MVIKTGHLRWNRQELLSKLTNIQYRKLLMHENPQDMKTMDQPISRTLRNSSHRKVNECAVALKMIWQIKKMGLRVATNSQYSTAGFTLSGVSLVQQQKQYVLTLRMKQKMINNYMNTADLFDFLQEKASNTSTPIVPVKGLVRKAYRSRQLYFSIHTN